MEREIQSVKTLRELRVFSDEMTDWLEQGRIPDGYYGKITIPIEDGRVQLIIVEEKTKPIRRKSQNSLE